MEYELFTTIQHVSKKIRTNLSREMVLDVKDDGPIVVDGGTFAMS